MDNVYQYHRIITCGYTHTHTHTQRNNRLAEAGLPPQIMVQSPPYQRHLFGQITRYLLPH